MCLNIGLCLLLPHCNGDNSTCKHFPKINVSVSLLHIFPLDTCKPGGSHSFHSDSSDLEFDFSDSERTEAFSEIRDVQGIKPFSNAV